jgi:hypothetical protein
MVKVDLTWIIKSQNLGMYGLINERIHLYRGKNTVLLKF